MRTILFLLLLSSVSFVGAQSKPLPYRNMMATTQEKAELSIVRTGVNHNYTWSFNSTGFASHDYPVGGSSSDTVSDWLFTPPIKVTAGAKLAFKYWVYGITGTATPSDEFSVWYGKNSMNPNNGSYVKIADLTNMISSQFVWKDTSGIVIPSTADSGFICFRYKATNNWFTLGLDSIVVAIPGLSIHQPETSKLSMYPNPAQNFVRIDCSTEIASIEIYNTNLQLVNSKSVGNNQVDVQLESMNPGYYIVKIITATGTLYRKLTIE
jgi:hypothetical protein